MWRLSSIPLLDASLAGGSAAPRMRASSSMLWNRRCTIGGQCIAAGLSITAIEAAKADSSDRRNASLLA